MKKNKKFKGMTLVECIVALAVMAIMTTGMAMAAGALGHLKVETNEVIKKNSYQSNLADNQSAGRFETEDAKIVISYGGVESKTFKATKNEAHSQKEADDGSITWEYQEGRNFKYYDGIEKE